MLRGIQTDNFLFLRNTETGCRLNRKVCQGNGYRRPCSHGKDTQALQSEKLNPSPVKQSGKLFISRSRSRCKQTDCKRTPDTIHHMYRNRTDRIVNTEFFIQKPYAKYNQKTCNCTNNHRTKRIRHITASRNRHKSCQGCVQTHGNIRLSEFYPCKNHTYYCCNCRGNGCGYKN